MAVDRGIQTVYDNEVFASNEAHIDDKILPKTQSFNFIPESQPDAEFEPPAGRTLPRHFFELSGLFLVLSSLPHLGPEIHQDSMHRCVRLYECEKTTVEPTNQGHKFPTQTRPNSDAKTVETKTNKQKCQDFEPMFEPRSDDVVKTAEAEKPAPKNPDQKPDFSEQMKNVLQTTWMAEASRADIAAATLKSKNPDHKPACSKQMKNVLRTTWMAEASRADIAAATLKSSFNSCMVVSAEDTCDTCMLLTKIGDAITKMHNMRLKTTKIMMLYIFCIALYRLKNSSSSQIKSDRKIPRWFGFVWANNIKAKPFTRRPIVCY